MKDLIERLEKATGPDRELGARTICLVRGYKFLFFESRGTALNPHQIDICAEDEVGHKFSFWAVDPTGSIDAALTLVPEGYVAQVRHIPEPIVIRRIPKTRGMATVWLGDALSALDAARTMQSTEAATAPIALCIAALRARAALTGEAR